MAACTIAVISTHTVIDMLLMASTDKITVDVTFLYFKSKCIRCNLSAPVGKRGYDAVSEDV